MQAPEVIKPREKLRKMVIPIKTQGHSRSHFLLARLQISIVGSLSWRGGKAALGRGWWGVEGGK